MKPGAATWLAEVRRQLDAAPWLKWALAAIVVLAALFIGQELESLRNGAQKRAIDAESALRRIKALQGQEEWIARAEESRKLRDALYAQVPPVATPGLAQAAVQGWLNELTAAAGDTQNMRISVENAAVLETPPGFLRVHATLSGGMTPGQALNLIRRIESATNLVVIETVDIRNDGNRVVSLSLNAYYRQATAGESE